MRRLPYNPCGRPQKDERPPKTVVVGRTGRPEGDDVEECHGRSRGRCFQAEEERSVERRQRYRDEERTRNRIRDGKQSDEPHPRIPGAAGGKERNDGGGGFRLRHRGDEGQHTGAEEVDREKPEPLDQRAEGAFFSIVARGEEHARLLADDALLVPVGDLDVQVVPNGFAHEFNLSLRKCLPSPARFPGRGKAPLFASRKHLLSIVSRFVPDRRPKRTRPWEQRSV